MAKKFDELELKDNFMFCAVMNDPDNCKEVLETILEIPIERVEVDKEKSLIYHPEYKGVRLDVYVKDEANTRYNVEMQIEQTPVEKRSRYYHSMIDTDLLLTGTKYESLPDSYVIFICDYRLFPDSLYGCKYKYTLQYRCREYPDLSYCDGNSTILLSTMGDNPQDISQKLLEFLRYIKDSNTVKESKTGFSAKLDSCIRNIKHSREMRGRYMLLEEILSKENSEGYRKGHAEGLAKGHAEGLQEGLREGKLFHLVHLVCKKLAKGKADKQIAEELEEDITTLMPIFEAAEAFAPDYPEEEVYRVLTDNKN